MKIGELAKQADCSVETIRYYEKVGLMSEATRDPVNNYRRYNQHHLQNLNFIRRCRTLDMTHDEIRHLLEAKKDRGASCQSINELIDEHLLHVQKKMASLQRLESKLYQLRQCCSDAKSTQDCGILQQLGE